MQSNFVDYVKVFLRSGNGGAGSSHFRREKFVEFGGPDGGDGGVGGSIILRGSHQHWTLIHLKYRKHIHADNGECGHGFTAQRWESPSWFGRLPPVPEESIVQRMVRFLQEKRITLDPALNPGTYTLHDPCNLVRMGGVVEEPRILMKAATQNFVEMTPNREKNFCCGGGGGQLAMSRYSARRLETGKIKMEGEAHELANNIEVRKAYLGCE